MKYLVLLSVLISSCSSYLTLKDTSKAFASDFNSTFAVVVDYCKSSGIAIKTIDKENGIITTEYSSATNRRYNFNLSAHSDSTFISLSLYQKSYNGSDAIIYLSDNAKEFSEIFNSIEKRLSKNNL